ncbi:omptin family outer membrane protease [Limoniibacter endophyticus]|uniref:Outer membrane protease n=1 Tax=Limoniibacter endophyticus TaxID=1565040 RepID=A0A8J3GGA8_9HYPH|nr:omptin family outer membrane protease [Limoniibacter endophyticus]GHC67616.1 outer membrane protease [Limoniibacter endophyticus]
MKTFCVAALAGMGCVLASTGHARDLDWVSVDGALKVSGGVGLTFLRADELVWDGNSKISHLIWETTTPVLLGDISYQIAPRWILSISGTFAGRGFASGQMADYDWNREIVEYEEKESFSNWTDWSLDLAKLQHYVSADMALGYDLIQENKSYQVNLRGGFQYSDVYWKSYGGPYIYSVDDFRDDRGSFPVSQLGITYRQRHLQGFVGATFSQEFDCWSYSLSGRAGFTLLNRDHDHHLLREMYFSGKMKTAPTLGLKAEVGYRVSKKTTLVGHASFDKVFERRGDVTIPSNEMNLFLRDGGGAAFQAATIGLKAKYAF